AAGGNQGIRILDLTTGKELRTLTTGAPGNFGILTYSPDGKVLGAADHAGGMRFWDPATGNVLGQITPVAGRAGPRTGNVLSFSRDGKYVALGGDDLGRLGVDEKGHVTLYEVAAGKQTIQVDVQANHNVRAVMSPDGKMMATF